jgi:hypothetical protein
MFKSLIIGNGEIGKSLHKVIGGDIKDKEYIIGQYDIIHICFPYDSSFISEVEIYQNQYSPKYTVIHSTVPIGTSRKLKAIHSPVTGVHPYLEESLKTFTKFLGGEKAGEVADYFRKLGIKVYITDKSETTEMMKIMCTTHYGMEIEFVKEIKLLCDKYSLPFEMWSLWVQNYNVGYEKLGLPEYKKPNLIPNMQKIGGHCVTNNCTLLTNKFTEFINSDKYKEH